MFGKSPLLYFQLANNLRTKDDIITKALAGIVGIFKTSDYVWLFQYRSILRGVFTSFEILTKWRVAAAC